MKRDNVIVFAGARDLTQVVELEALAKEFPQKLHIVKLISADETSNKAAVEEIRTKTGRLDVVIANAGIAKAMHLLALETPGQAMRDHFEVNVIGPLVLFQASYPLLKASNPAPKFVVISSRVGSITIGSALVGAVPYGASKSAVNYLCRKLHFENDGIIVFPICPGPVDTDMTASNQDFEVFKSITFISVHQVVVQMLPIIDNATRPEAGPVFHTVEDDIAPW